MMKTKILITGILIFFIISIFFVSFLLNLEFRIRDLNKLNLVYEDKETALQIYSGDNYGKLGKFLVRKFQNKLSDLNIINERYNNYDLKNCFIYLKDLNKKIFINEIQDSNDCGKPIRAGNKIIYKPVIYDANFEYNWKVSDELKIYFFDTGKIKRVGQLKKPSAVVISKDGEIIIIITDSTAEMYTISNEEVAKTESINVNSTTSLTTQLINKRNVDPARIYNDFFTSTSIKNKNGKVDFEVKIKLRNSIVDTYIFSIDFVKNNFLVDYMTNQQSK